MAFSKKLEKLKTLYKRTVLSNKAPLERRDTVWFNL